MKRWALVVATVSVFGLMVLSQSCDEADAHTNTVPANMPTFANGQILTADNLNNAFSHVHYTMSGNITNDNISPNAAIVHTKLATPGLVPKALFTGRFNAYDGGSVPLTYDTTVNVTSVKQSSTSEFEVKLTSEPSVANQMAITLTPLKGNAVSVCTPFSRQIGASASFVVSCYNSSDASPLTISPSNIEGISFSVGW